MNRSECSGRRATGGAVKKIDRVMQLSRLLSNRCQPVPLTFIQTQLGCSERTARRLLEDLRNRFKAPVEYDRTRRGWTLGNASGEVSELPGLWFSDAELYAFMVSQRLLADLQPGIFDEHIAPIRARLEALLAHAAPGRPDLARRVRILQMAARPVNVEHFRKITTALLDRKQLRVLYHGRERDEITERTVSPQRLVYYRSNWYLDAWCHLRNDLRSFSLDIDESGQLMGFASYGTFRAWPAYKYTVEHSVYVHKTFQGRGVGSALRGSKPKPSKISEI